MTPLFLPDDKVMKLNEFYKSHADKQVRIRCAKFSRTTNKASNVFSSLKLGLKDEWYKCFVIINLYQVATSV